MPWVAGAGALVLGVLLVGAVMSALAVRRDLAVAEAALQRGRTQIVSGDAEAALASFREARSGFDDASDGAEGFWLRPLAMVPVGGRNVDALAAIAFAGERVAEAGGTLARAGAELPNGFGSLAPASGRVPIELLPELGIAAADASRDTADALGALESAPEGLLLGPVGAALSEAGSEIRTLHGSLSAGAELLEGLPSFLGADGPRRYFFGAQNPAELRGTGGVMGAYSIMTIDDGRFRFSPFAPVQTLPRLDPDQVPTPTEEYAANYDPFRGDGRFWLAINLTPDFPTAAEAILGGYEASFGERLDGVILADPFALEALLRAAGPVEVPGLDRTVGAEEVVAFTANKAYGVYRDPATRKRVLGSVATAVFNRFLEQPDTDIADLRALAGTASERHLLVYSVDQQVGAALRSMPVGGAFEVGGGDLLSVIENSSGGTKVDFYQDRRVRYDVQLFDEGFAKATTQIWLANRAPTRGQPSYVIGPNPGYARRGEGGQLLTVYCADRCRLEQALRDDSSVGLWEGTELGHPFYQDYFRTASGETSHLSLRWAMPAVWQGDDTGGVYHLTFWNQTTIRPTDLQVTIRAPEGMDIVEATPGMDVDGGLATWRGRPTSRLELFVRFEPPLPVEIWRSLT